MQLHRTKNNEGSNHTSNATVSNNTISYEGEAGGSGQSISQPGGVTAERFWTWHFSPETENVTNWKGPIRTSESLSLSSFCFHL